jgi:hypothetical protein
MCIPVLQRRLPIIEHWLSLKCFSFVRLFYVVLSFTKEIYKIIPHYLVLLLLQKNLNNVFKILRHEI